MIKLRIAPLVPKAARRRRPEGAPARPAHRSIKRWAWVGAWMGLMIGLCLFAPATWLASAVQSATQGRVQLAEAQGTLWAGSALLVLTGGPGSRDARLLPGRLNWTLAPLSAVSWRLSLNHERHLHNPVQIDLLPGLGRMRVEVHHPTEGIGHWPAAWLAGLGTPWNTLQMGGAVRLDSHDLAFEWAQGRLAFQGTLTLELRDLSSRLATLPRLGTYQIKLQGDAAGAGTAQIHLSSAEGSPLRLSGSGSWSASGLRLRGEATATDEDAPALANLLNIIGRREGTRTLLTIG